MRLMSQRAFTLIEVMVSLAVFAFSAIVLAASYVHVLNAYARANDATLVDQDVRFARQMLFREAELEEVEEGREFESAEGRRVAWRAIVEPTLVPDLFEVNFICEVDGGTGGERKVVEERFRMLRPTWSEDDDREQLAADLQDRVVRYLEDLNARR